MCNVYGIVVVHVDVDVDAAVDVNIVVNETQQ